ncbi:MAG: hypothetical protein NTX42_02270 [Methanothrix sp.]|nr:hypothetical protein [Methanothrix sp.]
MTVNISRGCTRTGTGARVRAPAWGGGAVIGRNQGGRGKGAAGPWIS